MSPNVPTSPAVVGRAERVAAILDQPQIVLLGDAHDLLEIERIAQRVRDHDQPRAVG